tara:strand:- start:109 stop:501 length:393 start_codon:yes stop_codon:yes gene_type:complete
MKKKKKRILVDMSAAILHHGHIRLLRKASKYGKVYVGLATDKEIKSFKNIKPELNYSSRKEVVSSIKYVSGVVKSKAKIDSKFLKKHKFDFLIHGSDNQNPVDKKYVKIFKRTKNISTTIIRKRAIKNLR